MAEINEILKKYDIAGVITLHTPGHSEYLLKLDPSYSCATLTSDGIRLKATEAMYGKKKRDQMLDDTANMVVCLAESTGRLAMNLIDLEDLIKTKFEIIKGKDSHTAHDTQNN